jgi:hypothetical protein
MSLGWVCLLFESLDIYKGEPILCEDVYVLGDFCACVGRYLYVKEPGGFTLNDICWEISARVRVWKLLVQVTTIGVTCTYSRRLLCRKIHSLFEWFIDVVDIVYGFHDVAIDGVFTLYELSAPSSFICGIFY